MDTTAAGSGPGDAHAEEAAGFYTGIVTDVYAALRSTRFDAARYLEFVRQAGEPALELGCGDDGPFLELARRGIDVEGVDSSPDMIDRCRARLAREGLEVATYCQPMQRLSLPRSYRSVYLAGPTFNLLPDDATAAQALRSIAAHLLPGGRALVPLWIPPATSPADFGVTREAVTAAGAVARYTVEGEQYDESTRTRRTSTRYEWVEGDSATCERRQWVLHWHTPDGFGALAGAAGLQVADMSGVTDGEFTALLRRG